MFAYTAFYIFGCLFIFLVPIYFYLIQPKYQLILKIHSPLYNYNERSYFYIKDINYKPKADEFIVYEHFSKANIKRLIDSASYNKEHDISYKYLLNHHYNICYGGSSKMYSFNTPLGIVKKLEDLRIKYNNPNLNIQKIRIVKNGSYFYV